MEDDSTAEDRLRARKREAINNRTHMGDAIAIRRVRQRFPCVVGIIAGCWIVAARDRIVRTALKPRMHMPAANAARVETAHDAIDVQLVRQLIVHHS